MIDEKSALTSAIAKAKSTREAVAKGE